MKVQPLLILTASVNVLLISQMACQAVANQPGRENETRENFQNLFNSIAENDGQRGEAFRQILKQGVIREERSFGGMKEEMRMKRSRNERTAKNVGAFKRETHAIIQDTESMQAKIERIFRAAENNDFKTVKVLIEEKGVPVNVTNEMGQTLAHIAATTGYREMLQYVVEKYPTVLTKKDHNKITVIWLAVERKAMDVIDYFRDVYRTHPPGLDYREICSILWHSAIHFGQKSTIDFALEWMKCDVNYLGDYEKPPLFAAIENRQLAIFHFLLREARANITALDVYGSNILFEIVNIGDLDTMKFVMKDRRMYYIDLNARNAFGDTILHRAALLNHFDIVKYLVGERGVLVNVVGGNHMTPLHLAGYKGHDEIYEYLVEHGANVRLLDFEGKTPEQRREETKQIKSIEKSANRSRRSLPSPNLRSRHLRNRRR